VLRFLIGTSAQLGYTLPFTLVDARKFMTEDKLRTDTILQALKTTQKKRSI